MEAITISQVEKSLIPIMKENENPYLGSTLFKILRYFRQVQLSYENYNEAIENEEDVLNAVKNCFKLNGVSFPKTQATAFLKNPNSKRFLDLFFYFDESVKVKLFNDITYMSLDYIERPKNRLCQEKEEFTEYLEEVYLKSETYYIWNLLWDICSNSNINFSDCTFTLPNLVNRKETGNDSLIWIITLFFTSICPVQFIQWYIRKYKTIEEKM